MAAAQVLPSSGVPASTRSRHTSALQSSPPICRAWQPTTSSAHCVSPLTSYSQQRRLQQWTAQPQGQGHVGSGASGAGAPRHVCSALRKSSGTTQESGNGVYILMLVNVVLFLADHVIHVPGIHALYLNHANPAWWQWITHMFCHANWGHISNNLFLLLTFGRLVEELEGPWGVTAVYILCGLGAALASYLLSPHNIVSVGASGAIFGLFAVSVLTRLSSFNLRRLLESVVLGQFVVRQVWDELNNQVAGGLVVGGLQVSHLAHLGGAMAGVLLVLLLQQVPSGKEDET